MGFCKRVYYYKEGEGIVVMVGFVGIRKETKLEKPFVEQNIGKNPVK